VLSASKVVVVDDTAEVLELIVAVLMDEGYQVVPCKNGTTASAVVAREAPHLVILDLRMAGVGDWQVLEELRADPRTEQTPILLCPGAVDELRAAEDDLKARGCEILAKPFDIDMLVERVERMIGSPDPGA
jgi:CheY-like chemotaxis protein